MVKILPKNNTSVKMHQHFRHHDIIQNMQKISWPADLTPLSAKRSGFTLQFFSLKSKYIHIYGKSDKFRWLAFLVVARKPAKSLGGNIAPPPLYLIGLRCQLDRNISEVWAGCPKLGHATLLPENWHLVPHSSHKKELSILPHQTFPLFRKGNISRKRKSLITFPDIHHFI